MLWLSKRYSLTEIGIFKDFIDYHSHILPSVDDGVSTTQQALDILHRYEELQVSQVVLTPHIMDCLPQNYPHKLRSKFDTFKELYTGNITLSLGGEYMIDSNFKNHLAADDMLTICDNIIMVETSYLNAPMNFRQILYELVCAKYIVLLAHPERFTYMTTEIYNELKQNGVLFQLDLLSLAGSYGDVVMQRAQTLLSLNHYDVIGSDIHSLDMFNRSICQRTINGKISTALIELKGKSAQMMSHDI